MLRRMFLLLSAGVICMSGAVIAADPVFDAAAFKPEGSEAALKYRILKPEFKADEKLPLVLCLHGAGERGDDNEKTLGHFTPIWTSGNPAYRAVFVVPQVPNGQIWATSGWSTSTSEMQPEPSQSMKLTRALVDDLCQKLPIDRDRIYVTGLSMGGYGTWEFAQRYPEVVAAIAPVCGGGDTRSAKRIAQIPIWAFHGDKDTAVKPIESTRMIEAVKEAGGKPRLTMYEGVGHNSWAPAFREKDFLPWMFAQKRQSN